LRRRDSAHRWPASPPPTITTPDRCGRRMRSWLIKRAGSRPRGNRWLGRSNGIAGFAETLRSVGEVIPGRRSECGRSTTWRQSMPRRTTRTAAALAAILAGGLAAVALRPPGATNATLAAHNPAEIRTVTIRRTIHIVRHVPGPAGPGSSGARGRVVAAKPPAVSTHASGSHKSGATAAAGTVVTRASGSHGASLVPSPARAGTVTTRASGSRAAGSSNGGPASTPVPTRASGSHGGGPATSANPVTTRASGGGHVGGDGGDGGDGNGHGDD
jgi:hypothetical protein